MGKTVDIKQRKADHLELCATDDVAFRGKTTLLQCVRLMHQSLPELAEQDVDTSIRLLGKKLRAPIVIAGMTGGHEKATKINGALATVAESLGYGFGLGSQRAMHEKPELGKTFAVRKAAPSTLILGNLGVMQARKMKTGDVQSLVAEVGADALCLHMNPAMEMIQAEGDRDFTGALDTFARLRSELPVPVIAKETGNGISARAAQQLMSAGIRHVDTSGAGGTSWVGVETLRASGDQKTLGENLWDWGIPTAASVVYCVQQGLTVIATGGIATGLDAARAIALGAQAVGIARPVYQAFLQGGEAQVRAFLQSLEHELRTVMLLCGSKNVSELQQAPRVLTGELKDWISAS